MAERLISVPAARSHIDAVVADPILKACMHNVLDGVPAVDAVEVVRCKDCQKWIADITCHTYINGEMHPMGCCQHTRRFTADCDFCSYGERRCGNG